MYGKRWIFVLSLFFLPYSGIMAYYDFTHGEPVWGGVMLFCVAIWGYNLIANTPNTWQPRKPRP